MAEFVYEYLRNRYGNHNTAIEMGYNLDYACKRFKHNENFQLFHKILLGEVSAPSVLPTVPSRAIVGR